MRRILRDLKRTFPGAEIRITGSNHYQIVLPNGRTVVVASTPSSRFFLHRARADVRRLSKFRNPDESKGERP